MLKSHKLQVGVSSGTELEWQLPRRWVHGHGQPQTKDTRRPKKEGDPIVCIHETLWCNKAFLNPLPNFAQIAPFSAQERESWRGSICSHTLGRRDRPTQEWEEQLQKQDSSYPS